MRKRGIVAISAAAVVVLLTVAVLVFGTRGMAEIRGYELPSVNLSAKPDGVYTGELGVTRWALGVKVTVRNNRIAGIEISDKKSSNITPELIAKLNSQLVDSDEPRFDIVSGASMTSKGYLIAVAEALK